MTTTDIDVSGKPPRQAVLESLLAAHLDMVYAAALRQVGDIHRAEDVAQTVFLIAAKKQKYIPWDRAGAWLLKVTRYAVLNMQRCERRRRHHEAASAAITATEAVSEFTPIDSAYAQLDTALLQLSDADRELIIQRYFQNRSISAVASAFRTSDNTISKRLGRALHRLQHNMERGDVSPTAIASLLASAALRTAPAALTVKILRTSASFTGTTTVSILTLGLFLMSVTTKHILAAAILLLLLLIPVSLTWKNASSPHSPYPPNAPLATVAPAAASSQSDRKVVTLTGTVTDSVGKPIEHAYISQGFSPFAGKIFHYTYTDSDGHFAIPNVGIGDDLILAALANGYSPQVFRHGTVAANMPEAACTLLPGHTIRFRFLDERGHPIPNVVVSPTIWDMGGIDLRTHNFITGRHGNPPYDGMLSDSEGRFVWNSAPADQVFFFLSTYDQADSYRLGRAQLAPSDQENVIVLRDALQASGTVVDNESGASIPEFNYFVGQGNDKLHADNWDAFPVHVTEGKWSRQLTDVLPFTFIRVEASGYAPVTQSFSEELKSVSLSFRLSKSAGTTLTVLQPDKQPAVDTRVYFAEEQKGNPASFFFPDANPVTEWSSPTDPPFVKTDEQGRCHLPDFGKALTRIIINDDSGFTELPASDLKNNQVITLEPWAHINAHINIGPKAAPHAAVALIIEFNATANAPRVRMELPGRTDADGNFFYPRIPPRPLTIARSIDSNPGTRFNHGTYSPSRDLTPSPGETLSVSLGGTGQFLTGRIVAPDSHAPNSKWIFSLGRITPPRPPSIFTAAELAELANLSPAQRQKRETELYTPERAKAEEKMLTDWHRDHPHPSAFFAVNNNGSFYADDIPPGDCILTLQALDPNTGALIATVTRNFTVPPTPTTQPIDLGDIAVEKSP